MALEECEESNEVRQKYQRDLQGQLHTWRDVSRVVVRMYMNIIVKVIYAWCIGQRRLASGMRGDVMDALTSWQAAVDEERLRIKDDPRFSTYYYYYYCHHHH